ncbi:substrate-binding domain-containing protein [Salipiger aestuarii]|uniref:ABC-type branched-subunit amino acid transport system substrate-binding protein n=2 Tax=Salipiger aestuarii TaxID=568098 RepID=A0A327YHB9_9RHOB|nr:substrate-binding domain-containing protein [Salipiger aestuarii]EIE51452.1 amino acid ABC transporter [Citreicella sp. 357]RAK19722.1 ABC-type branched-subunit amino acid transport system substrate-binding protein [Salipiger aestuarii]
MQPALPIHGMKIGLILSHDGLAGIWTSGCQGAALLAAAELNAAGGVLGQEIELVEVDSGETQDSAFQAAQRLAIDENIDAAIGLQSSDLRPAVRRGLCGLAPYIYTPHYEGGFCGPGTAQLGITDAEVLNPSLDWMVSHRKARRFFFVGNDYIWPRAAHGTTMDAVRRVGGHFIGDALLPFGSRDYAEILDRIRKARADVVVIAMLGEDSICFNRAFAEAGLSSTITRLNLAFDEMQLLALADGGTENLFAAQAYFDTSRGHGRDALVERYDACFSGRRPSMTANSVQCYDAIFLVAAIARQVGRIDGCRMAHFLRPRLQRDLAYRMIGREADANVRLAEADGVDFVVRRAFVS